MWFMRRDDYDWTNNKPVNEEDVEGYVGFVYEITNLTNGKKYVGKKLFTASRSYQIKGKKKKKRVTSDWQTYTGSNEELNKDIAAGHQIAKRILYLCKSKGWMSYFETKEIMARDAIISEDYYNSWCSAKIRQNHLRSKECPQYLGS